MVPFKHESIMSSQLSAQDPAWFELEVIVNAPRMCRGSQGAGEPEAAEQRVTARRRRAHRLRHPQRPQQARTAAARS